jgi:hypothetical protein
MTTVVAAPAAVAAPVAAPVVEYLGPGPLQQASSFINLTAGMPDPGKLKNETDAYGKALEGQLKKQSDAVIEEANIKKKMLEEQFKRDLAQYQLQVDERLKMAQMAVDKEAQAQLMGLQEAAINRKTVMEEEAAMKSAGYAKAKAMEEMMNRSKQVNKQFMEAEAKLTAEYQKVMRAGAKAMAPGPVPMVPEMAVQYAAPAYAAPAPAYAGPVPVVAAAPAYL